MANEQFILKGSEVWLNEYCYGRIGNIDNQATLVREDIVYQRLGSHPHILKYDGKVLVREDTYSLKVERALGNLRKLILDCPAPTEQTRLNMAVQIACGMVHVHSKNVFHCDFSYRRRSKIDDQEPLAAEESRYQLPLRGKVWEALDYTKKEIFALGCGIYEVRAWKVPFPEMTEEQIEEKYANEEFPDTEGLLAGDIIRACWNEKFEAAEDVEIALREKLMDLGQELVDGVWR